MVGDRQVFKAAPCAVRIRPPVKGCADQITLPGGTVVCPKHINGCPLQS